MKIPEGIDTFDYQFVYIREALKPHFEKIKNADEPQVELAYAMYTISKNYISNIIQDIEGVKVSVIGGI